MIDCKNKILNGQLGIKTQVKAFVEQKEATDFQYFSFLIIKATKVKICIDLTKI